MRNSIFNATPFKRALLALVWLVALSAPAALVRAAPISFPLQIDTISVCDPAGRGGAGSCPSGT